MTDLQNSSAFSAHGALLIFSMLLPGTLVFGFSSTLFEKLAITSLSVAEITTYSLMFGFISNLVGHFFGMFVLCHIFKSSADLLKLYPFELNKEFYFKPNIVLEAFRRDTNFWINYYFWYWNTGFGLLSVVLVKVTFLMLPEIMMPSKFEIFMLIGGGLMSLFLLYIGWNLKIRIFDVHQEISSRINEGFGCKE